MPAMRPIDAAMSADRPEKRVIRERWLDRVGEEWRSHRPDDVPNYLCLPGRDGQEIQMLIERDLIDCEENGAIRADNQYTVIAVESDSLAAAELQHRFPGLKILTTDIRDLLSGSSPIAFPSGVFRKYCRARVVNLDFNTSLNAQIVDGQLVFPIVNAVSKIAQLHATPTHLDWTLFLTINATIGWPAAAEELVTKFLRANWSTNTDFASASKDVLGHEVFMAIYAEGDFKYRDMNSDVHKAILKVLVPKRVAFEVHRQGWMLNTDWSWSYGGKNGSAPMLTFGVRFMWDSRASIHSHELYRDSLSSIFEGVGKIDEEGNLHVGSA